MGKEMRFSIFSRESRLSASRLAALEQRIVELEDALNNAISVINANAKISNADTKYFQDKIYRQNSLISAISEWIIERYGPKQRNGNVVQLFARKSGPGDDAA